MISIKLECDCGQKYGFDVEPVDGHMPNAVKCPACGADGTLAANQIIAQTLAEQPVAIANKPAPLRVAVASVTPAAVSRRSASLLPAHMDPAQAKHEARAKIMWGDKPRDVVKFLVIQGFDSEAAADVVDQFYRERVATLRAEGVKKIGFGACLMSVPVIALLIFISIGVMSLKLMGIAVVIGIWGAYVALNGTYILFAPKSTSGDVTEQ